MLAKHNIFIALCIICALVYATDLVVKRETRCKMWFFGLTKCPSDQTLKMVGWAYGLLAAYVYFNPSIVYRYL